jgi:tetratricopeptide (TPR) repeat protein
LPRLEDEDAPDDGFGESSRYAAHLDRGWSLLDQGDFAAARKSAEHANELRPESPDAALLLGAVALAEGAPEESAEWYGRAIELDPEYLEPYAAAAQVWLLDLGDAARSLALCEDAIALESAAPLDRLDMSLLAAEAEHALDRGPAAASRLAALEDAPRLRTVLDDDDDARATALSELWGEPNVAADEEDLAEALRRAMGAAARLGRIWLDLGEPRQARGWLLPLVARAPDDADAWYFLGEAESRLGEARAAVRAALQVYRLDAQLRVPKWVPKPAALQRRVLEIIGTAAVPEIRALVGDELAFLVLVLDVPAVELVLEGVDPRLPALTLATRAGPLGVGDGVPVPTGIAVYRRNIVRTCRDAEQLEADLRHAVLDELAVFLQLDDAARTSLDLPPLVSPLLDPAPVEDEPPPRRRKRGRMHS